ncbi:hypothetical protein GGE46_006098 [Rhizobium etli]|uniref:Uncharacterized protein n=1 Tax=Rhizobium etli TaxID=29449 RepID=A0A7W6YCM9_RHIET|nr:hypothetical protein [Rhizobium etli]MBB4539307.1 hypothetical protein [Rhizobium etli]
MNGRDRRRGIGHDHRHQRGSHLGLRLLDLAKLLAPPEQLADMDTGRASNHRDNGVRVKAGSDEPLIVLRVTSADGALRT